MQPVILISVNDETELGELVLNPNQLCIVSTTGDIYRGDPNSNLPVKVFDSNSSNFANLFLTMGG